MTGTVLNLGAASHSLDPEMDSVHVGLTLALMEQSPRNGWAFQTACGESGRAMRATQCVLFSLPCQSHSTIWVYASVSSFCQVGFREGLFLTTLY